MNAQAAKTVAEIYLKDFEAEIATTVALLRAIPSTNLAYRPDPKASTGIALCRHLVLNDVWLLEGVAEAAYGPVPDASDACGLQTPADCAERYDREVRAVLQRIDGRTGEELAREVDLFGVYKMPAAAFIAIALKHSIHHRGQLSSYARAMGGTVPAIYGPSADSES